MSAGQRAINLRDWKYMYMWLIPFAGKRVEWMAGKTVTRAIPDRLGD